MQTCRQQSLLDVFVSKISHVNCQMSQVTPTTVKRKSSAVMFAVSENVLWQ